MRVLMINRHDAFTVPGGDTVQMQQTGIALVQLGIKVEFATSQELPNKTDFDIVHLFNLQTVEDTQLGMNWAKTHKIPVVLSPIFWDMRDAHFARAICVKPLWKTLAQLLGMQIARGIYKVWQRIKFPVNPRWRVQRTLLLQSDAVLPNSEIETWILMQYFYLNSSWRRKVTLVPNAINASLYREIPSYSRFVAQNNLHDFVLQVGWIGESKNQLGLINALFDIPVKIVFVGPPSPYEHSYYSKCFQRGQERGNTLFLGPIPHEELPPIYAAAAVHVLPSWRETPGLASLEAAAAGCRVVTTSIGSAREYFGDMAWYCNPFKPSTIKQAVLAALDSPKSSGLRKHVLSNYTWERVAQLTHSTYQKVLRE